MPKHLELRNLIWYAVLTIPEGLRKDFGKRRFRKSLKTDSLSKARRDVLPVVAKWRTAIDKARAMDGVMTPERRAFLLELASDEADHIGALDVADLGEHPTSSAAAQEHYAKAVRSLETSFTAHLEDYLDSADLASGTATDYRSIIERFAMTFPSLSDVERKEVRAWAMKLTLSPSGINKTLVALKGYWKHLRRLGVVDEDSAPFDNLDLPRRRSDGPTRKPFLPADVLKLRDEAYGNLRDLIELAMYTGMRIEECCQLKVEDVHKDWFAVANSKTTAGLREVPIHNSLSATMKRLVRDSKDGYIIPGLRTVRSGKRSTSISSRFGTLKTRMGFGPEHVFHSIRKTVITIFENAGCPEGVVADIVGHAKKTITFGLYSGGNSIKRKREALDKLRY